MEYGLVVGPGLQLTFTFQTLTQGFLEPEAMKGWEVGARVQRWSKAAA